MEQALLLSLHSQSVDPELNGAHTTALFLDTSLKPGCTGHLGTQVRPPIRLGFGQGAHTTQDLGSNPRPPGQIHSKPLCNFTGVLENRDSSVLGGLEVKISYKSSRAVSKRALRKNCADRIQTTLASI